MPSSVHEVLLAVMYFSQDELKAKAKIEEISESKENDTSAPKPGV